MLIKHTFGQTFDFKRNIEYELEAFEKMISKNLSNSVPVQFLDRHSEFSNAGSAFDS